MSVFDKWGKRKVCSAVYPQTVQQNYFNSLSGLLAPTHIEPQLYKRLRHSLPVIDTSIMKLVRLTGGFSVKTADGKYQKELDDFVNSVPLGTGGTGLQQFMDTYFSELLTYGTSAGEIVVCGDTICSLYNIPIESIRLKRDSNDFNTILMCKNNGVDPEPVEYQELCVHSVLNPDAGSIYGNSILKGLPFVSSVLLKIFNSIGQNWERAGNLRYAVTYNPGSDMLDKAYAQERAVQIANEWSSAMNSDTVKDFVAVGDVEIKVIGADNQILDSNVPVRQLMEQIISKLGLPPFMLGLSWSTTERMSSQQADALTTELNAYRRLLTPVIEKICTVFLRLLGSNSKVTVEWNTITLKDAVEDAKAKLYSAQANLVSSGGEKND